MEKNEESTLSNESTDGRISIIHNQGRENPLLAGTKLQ